MLDDRSTSTFPVQALAGSGATSARVEWRYAPDVEGDTTTGWTTATKLQLKLRFPPDRGGISYKE